MTTPSHTLSNPGTRVDRPDLDWSQVKETVAMLCLAMAQIETTLTDSSRSVGDLTRSFTDMADDARKIHALASEEEVAFEGREEIRQISARIGEHMNMAVVAFQFYDRLSQKLARVNRSLSHLGDLIGDGERIFNPTAWRQLQKEIRSNYGMECERLMFDVIMQGKTIEQALELYRHQFDHAEVLRRDTTDDDVELF